MLKRLQVDTIGCAPKLNQTTRKLLNIITAFYTST